MNIKARPVATIARSHPNVSHHGGSPAAGNAVNKGWPHTAGPDDADTTNNGAQSQRTDNEQA